MYSWRQTTSLNPYREIMHLGGGGLVITGSQVGVCEILEAIVEGE